MEVGVGDRKKWSVGRLGITVCQYYSTWRSLNLFPISFFILECANGAAECLLFSSPIPIICLSTTTTTTPVIIFMAGVELFMAMRNPFHSQSHKRNNFNLKDFFLSFWKWVGADAGEWRTPMLMDKPITNGTLCNESPCFLLLSGGGGWRINYSETNYTLRLPRIAN